MKNTVFVFGKFVWRIKNFEKNATEGYKQSWRQSWIFFRHEQVNIMMLNDAFFNDVK